MCACHLRWHFRKFQDLNLDIFRSWKMTSGADKSHSHANIHSLIFQAPEFGGNYRKLMKEHAGAFWGQGF